MKDEYISIKEFAERAGVSAQSIYKRLNGLNNPLNQYVKLVDNQKMLNISALKEVYDIEVEQPIQPNHSTHSTHSTLETVNDTLYDVLLKQLEAKDNQIKELNERLKEAQKALSQEQQLHLLSKQQLFELETAKEEVKPQSWWERLFRKNF